MPKHIAKLTLELKSHEDPRESVRILAMRAGQPPPELGPCKAMKTAEFLGVGDSAKDALAQALGAMTEFTSNSLMGAMPTPSEERELPLGGLLPGQNH